MPEHEILSKPGLVPLTSEVAFLAASMNEKIYENPKLYQAVMTSGRLITDSEVVYYVPRQGEDDALSAVNAFIDSDHSRRIELDRASDDLLYQDPTHLDLTRRFTRTQGSRQREMLKDVTASRLGFVIDRIVAYDEQMTSKATKAAQPFSKAG